MQSRGNRCRAKLPSPLPPACPWKLDRNVVPAPLPLHTPQCNADKKCFNSFHVLCAANAGLHLAMRERPAAGAEEAGLECVNYCRLHSEKHRAGEGREGAGKAAAVELVAWRSPGGATAKTRKRGPLYAKCTLSRLPRIAPSSRATAGTYSGIS